ncbi:hypothetical protein BDZ90DRAFT_267857 [Jaminaea rosea]|uniref:Uncharacterized protein n=1 Tax=Jaminaea rosea TaxID=1569628 RepID=A0A316UJK3_9BASI|nr:hypothetical protein BDZ90DRAFT_267857 [Jaminaea rosea]PWN25462.1 hypothetical protein BDZ90DRAFT_267857 [Jaminaea rosea]
MFASVKLMSVLLVGLALRVTSAPPPERPQSRWLGYCWTHDYKCGGIKVKAIDGPYPGNIQVRDCLSIAPRYDLIAACLDPRCVKRCVPVDTKADVCLEGAALYRCLKFVKPYAAATARDGHFNVTTVDARASDDVEGRAVEYGHMFIEQDG